jgi:farnesyl-diphosphate farnesyltransferase
MFDYARYNLSLADSYTKSLSKGPVLNFCQIPLTLAHATLDVMMLGKPKLTRNQVMALLAKIPS